ncbi:DUF4129 domain-containing protein [Frondihabitans sp. Leaf304]|uniref:DUF4129 domain-containing protein n=1 Tax=Frondihabitans sp. Leaf304 TaxID=1736329 RepID=UPI00070164B1|nr:DUF4129 domain-containing protein [Frondihabitans sp. Leaf304]KQQ28021.1 hypothetical protein ASF54_04655 [Frondihabitans sp. Leaf304]
MSAPLTPSPDEARRLLQEELAKGEYAASRPGLLDRAASAFWDWVTSLRFGSVEGAPALVLVVLLVVVAAVLVVVFVVYGLPRLNRRGVADGALFGVDDSRSADDLRTSAARAAASGDHAQAIIEQFRAVARALDERDLVTTSPGTTAHAFATQAGVPFAAFASRILDSSRVFDEVRYLDRPGTATDFEALRALDAELEAATPTRPASTEVLA